LHACNNPSSQIGGYSLKFGFKLALLYGPIQQIGRSCTEYSKSQMCKNPENFSILFKMASYAAFSEPFSKIAYGAAILRKKLI